MPTSYHRNSPPYLATLSSSYFKNKLYFYITDANFEQNLLYSYQHKAIHYVLSPYKVNAPFPDRPQTTTLLTRG